MSTRSDSMSPDESPDTASSRLAGVRRVNNLPLFIVIGAMGIFLLVMALVAANRASESNRPEEAKAPKLGSTNTYAEELAGGQGGGLVPPDVPALPEMPPMTIVKPDVLELPPQPPGQVVQTLKPPRDEEEERIRLLKLQQFEEAVRSKSSVPLANLRNVSQVGGKQGAPTTREDLVSRLAAARQEAAAATATDPATAYAAKVQQVQALMPRSGAGVPNAEEGPAKIVRASATNDVSQFNSATEDDRWRLDSSMQAPRGKFELRAGFVIPAVLISGINSELPGQIMAQVSQDVFDTPTGRFRLIPQGSRLVGRYSSEVAFGQARVLVGWQRIVFPDGKALDIGSMPGADQAGYSGLGDQVNRHYFRIFASAFLLSGVTAGVAMSQPTSTGSTAPTASSAMSQALGQQLGQVTAQMIAKNMNVAPTLEIRPGFRMNVMVTKDITFQTEYKSFDY